LPNTQDDLTSDDGTMLACCMDWAPLLGRCTIRLAHTKTNTPKEPLWFAQLISNHAFVLYDPLPLYNLPPLSLQSAILEDPLSLSIFFNSPLRPAKWCFLEVFSVVKPSRHSNGS